jgi:retinoid hydroxylase
MSQHPEKPLPPGDKGLPVLGHTLAFFRNPAKFSAERRAKYGAVYRSNLLGSETVTVVGTKANQWVFSGENKYLVNRWIYTIRRLLGANSVAMVTGDEHRKRRAMLMNYFKYETMTAFTPAIVELSQQHMQRWAAEGTVTFEVAMRRLAFEIIAAFLFGEQRKHIDLVWLSQQFKVWTSGMFNVPVNLPFTGFGKAIRAKHAMNAVLTDIVEARRRTPTEAYDILNALLQARDEHGQPLPTQTIIDDLQVLLFAGHDTTVSVSTNMMMFLAQHPQALERAREEASSLPADALNDLESLKQLPYLDAVLMETMRLVPPVAGLFRKTTTDTEFGGYRIPKDTAVTITPAATHYEPSLWTTPEAFDPERFLRGEHKREPFQHIPFGGGPRLCLGQNFAMIEMRILLATALRGFRWDVLPDQDLSLKMFPLPIPNSGLRLRFVNR